ncbi:hypothetical protein [Hydrotalea flava]|uniref:hypothetical protein n=1 Tax=Hydrotalea flava TaxID=714549 RepID=UPI00142ED95F|nr:hypothetical protein [Hydrotalea flava]
MNKKQTILTKFYNDIIVITFSLLFFIVTTTIISMMLSGSRIDGMFKGIYFGLGLSMATFYYLRGQFKILTTIIQALLNTALTVLTFFGMDYLIGDNETSKIAYGYVYILISIPLFITTYKQILDNFATKLNADKRAKEPVNLT